MGMHIFISAVHFLALTEPDGLFVQSYNSLGQNPCWVAAYMLSICGNDSKSFYCLLCLAFFEHYHLVFFVAFTMWPLQPGGSYFGPSSAQDSNLCKCNSVTYSLLSACGGCQGGTWIPYDSCCCYLLNSWDLCICP